MKTTSKWRQPENEDDYKNEDNIKNQNDLKNEDNLKKKFAPLPLEKTQSALSFLESIRS